MFSSLRTQTLSWWHETPLPTIDAANPIFQDWHHYFEGRWQRYKNSTTTGTTKSSPHDALRIVTWNIDSGAPSPGARILALLSSLEDKPDVFFFQEVSKPALESMLGSHSIQNEWISSESNLSNFGRQSFITVTLVSKSYLASHPVILGVIWRVPLPSRFDRDALCCDLLLNQDTSCAAGRSSRIRLINVHLDSLPINPSLRPQQLEIATKYLRTAGRGRIAGDFNPVLPGDDALVSQKGLADAWVELHPEDPGYTWGMDGDKPFLPNRLDKIVLFNLQPSSMSILPADQTREDRSTIPFSDHCGLSATLTWK